MRLPIPHNISILGFIVFMFVIVIAVQGVVLVVVSSQNLDLKSFFVSFNSSVVENRKQNNISGEFRELQLKQIQQQQNNTQELLPALFNQFNQTEQISEVVQNLSEVMSQQRFIAKEIRDNQVQIAYDQDRIRNSTEKLADIIIGLLNETKP